MSKNISMAALVLFFAASGIQSAQAGAIPDTDLLCWDPSDTFRAFVPQAKTDSTEPNAQAITAVKISEFSDQAKDFVQLDQIPGISPATSADSPDVTFTDSASEGQAFYLSIHRVDAQRGYLTYSGTLKVNTVRVMNKNFSVTCRTILPE